MNYRKKQSLIKQLRNSRQQMVKSRCSGLKIHRVTGSHLMKQDSRILSERIKKMVSE